MTDSTTNSDNESSENVSNQIDTEGDMTSDAVEDAELVSDDEALSDIEDDVESSEAGEVYEEVSEERRGSWASRALFWLLLLIAGAAGALWGGPKLAPMLPGWAAPVAKILTPGGDAALAEAEAIRTDVDTRFGDLDARLADVPTSETIEEAAQSSVAASVADIETRLSDRIAALEGAEPIADATQAVEELGTRVEGIEGRLEALSGEVAGVSEALRAAALDGGTIPESTMAEIASNATKMAGIQSGIAALTSDFGSLSTDLGSVQEQVAGVSDGVSGLTNRLDTMETEAQEREEAAKAAVAQAEAAAASQARDIEIKEEIEAVRLALDNGSEFSAQIERLSELGVTPVPEILNNAANGWMPTPAKLQAEFKPLSHQAIRETIKADAGDGAAGRIGAFLQSQVATRSLEPSEGDGTDAILSRIEAAIAADDLTTVQEEASALPEVAATLLKPWLRKVAARKAALEAVDAIGASAS